jgi:hypothetical protein
MHTQRSEEKAAIEENTRHSGLAPESRIVKLRREAPQEFSLPLAGEGWGEGAQPQKI